MTSSGTESSRGPSRATPRLAGARPARVAARWVMRQPPPPAARAARAAVLREIPAHDRPRERLLREGGAALADGELLAVLLRTGCAGASALDLGRELLAAAGGLAGLATLDAAALQRRGLGAAKAAGLLAALELARRVARAELPDRLPLAHPEAVARY